ncbi:MAG: small basic family protein [Armatimonadetes bacterium]|nr:small basic family protein [Armatimonadota bacterium]
MWLAPACALLGGFSLIFALPPLVPVEYANYLSVALLAGLDTVLGGLRAGLEERFDDYVFVTGFFINMLAATAIVWLGDLIGLRELYLAAVVALGIRMFTNLGYVRRLLVMRVRAYREMP